MSAAYQDLAARESQASDKLAAAAAERGQSCLSKTLATAGSAAIKSVQADSGGGAIGEPAADFRQLRSNTAVIQAKESDIARAVAVARRVLLEALEAGYRYDCSERSAILAAESDGLRFTVSFTDEDRKAITDFPVVGMSASEWSNRLGRALADAIDETLAKPLTGIIDPAAIPTMLGAVASAHGERLGSLAAEAYHAGVSAASKALGKALATAHAN